MMWYHEYLVHPGQTRMEETLRKVFYWPNLDKDVQGYVKTCRKCQISKRQRKKYGHLPAKKAEDIPWNRVNVDLIGPYTVRTPTKTHELRAMTMIDPATSWFEIAPIVHPNSNSTQRALDSCWLARYPRPQYVGYDNGNEFKWLFKELCENFGLTSKNAMDCDPQGNSVLE